MAPPSRRTSACSAAGCLLFLAATACGSGSAAAVADGGSGNDGGGTGSGNDGGAPADGSYGGGSSALSQQVVWPLSAQAQVLGNNLEIDVENLYGYATPGLTPLSSVESLAETVDDTLGALSTSVCAGDAKAADAAAASHALLAFVQGLPAGGGTSSMLQAQTSKEEQLASTLRSAITASPCVSQLTPPAGSPTAPVGTQLTSGVSLSSGGGTSGSDVQIPLDASQAYPAISVRNLSADPLIFASITIDYADGSTRSIGFGSYPEDGATTPVSGSADVAAGASLLVDVDARAIQSITLVGAALDCPEPPGGSDGGGPGGAGGAPCSGSVTIVGLAAGNGLSP